MHKHTASVTQTIAVENEQKKAGCIMHHTPTSSHVGILVWI